MKKFLAIVMTLAMVISMMTVVASAANAVKFDFATVECKAGETVVVPMVITSDIGVKTGGAVVKVANLPDGITLATSNAAAHVDGIDEDIFDITTKAHSYVKGTKTHTFSFKTWEDVTLDSEPLMNITFTVADTVAPGTYVIPFTYTAKNAATAALATEVGAACTIVVKADEPVITKPTATTINVPVAPTAGGVVTVFQVAGNATEFGVVYDGVEYPSLATAADLANYYAFAVELIGADGAITAYAK